MKKRIISLILVLITLVSYFSMPSLAYTITGFRWPSKTIYYAFPSGLASVYKTAWKDALTDWNKTNVTLILTSANLTDIYCKAENHSNVTWDGICYSQDNGGLYYTHADCILNSYYLNTVVANHKRSVAAHEIGHALGLGHQPSNAHSSIMNMSSVRYTVYGLYSPQIDDKNGVNAIYNW
ncbi:MAG: matrixin family metalloprotease [Hydrogeniiclostridium sp.]